MSVALRKPMTQAEFFDLAEAQNERYEFDGFQPVLMPGRSGNHTRIAKNILVQLQRRLSEDGPCEALGSDAGIQTVGNTVRYPDVLVTCSGFDGRKHLIPNPVIVFDVVSPSSIREDRVLKPMEYATVGSMNRCILVEQSVIELNVLWRSNDEPWHFETLTAGETLLLPEIGLELPVDSFYARVTFDAAVPPATAPADG